MKKPKINKKKYSFYKYNKNYPKQFASEKKILLKILPNLLKIEHFGSTSVPKIGGKEIIDIIIEVPKKDFEKSRKILQKSGYIFRPTVKKRLFSKKYYQNRKVHVHLTYQGTNEISRAVSVRDYLRKNKKEIKKYEKIKKKAVEHAQGTGKRYVKFKNSYLRELEKKAMKKQL
jgi:GrpB-like predicted nucleotidyltransferase (UPF0157 family)